MRLEEKLKDRVLSVNKGRGITTFDCIRKLKKIVDIKKIGHAGSLDPIASGLVLLLIGNATKLSNYLMDLRKIYTADIKLGQSTDTQDATGNVTDEGDWTNITESDLAAVLPDFLGKRYQKPPVYSALKHKGKPLYKLARKGLGVEKEPREIETHEIKLLLWDPPLVRIEVTCSRGLYVRTLAEEIGERLSVPSHLSGLTRNAIGHFDLDSAIPAESLSDLEEMDSPGCSLAEALGHMPAYRMNERESSALAHGIAPSRGAPAESSPGDMIRLLRPDGTLAGIVETGPAGMIKIRRVIKGG